MKDWNIIFVIVKKIDGYIFLIIYDILLIMSSIIYIKVVYSDSGLKVVKNVKYSDGIVTSSSVSLHLTGGERLPKNIGELPMQVLIADCIIYLVSISSCVRMWTWQISGEAMSSPNPITPEQVVFLGEIGQVVTNHIGGVCDASQVKMHPHVVSGKVVLEAPLRGGISKLKDKRSYSLQVKSNMKENSKGKLVPYLNRNRLFGAIDIKENK